MTKQLELARPPYGPPYAAERAWEPDGRDDWVLRAMRAGLTHSVEGAIMMDEQRHPELREFAHPGVEVVHFRSNRLRGSAIDTDIAGSVMYMSLDDIEKFAKHRHEVAEDWDHYPRACLDAFQQDIIDHIDEAGMWDRAATARWKAHKEAVAAHVDRWLSDTTIELHNG